MESGEAIVGLHSELFGPCGLAVYMATQTTISQFVTNNFDPIEKLIYSSIFERECLETQEIVGDIQNSEMIVHRMIGSGSIKKPEFIVWNTSVGIFYGQIKLPPVLDSSITRIHLLPVPESSGPLISLRTTDFHFLLLYSAELIVLNRLDNQQVCKVRMPMVPHSLSSTLLKKH